MYTKKQRVMSMAVGVLFLFMMFASLFYVVKEADHNCTGDPLLTSLTEFGKADKQGVCEDSKVPEKENKALVEERIGQIKRELFVGGVIGLAERVGKG